MIQSRETYYAALFAKLATASNFATTSRVLRHWTDVGPEEMPALFQAQTTETREQMKGQGVKWTLRTRVYMYLHTNTQQLGGSVIPAQELNTYLDAIEATLAPDNFSDNVQTLGGLVSHCWIDGTIETSEGTLGDHSVAIIPIAMLVPS